MGLKHYKDYFINKFVSIFISFIIIYLISLIENIQAQWRLLILILIIFGHGHFITSYVYQVPSLKYKLPRTRNILAFVFLLAVLSGALLYLRFGLGYNDLALVFIGAYFLIHSALNERTMFTNYSKNVKNSYLITFIIISFLLWVYFGTVLHPSFSFLLTESIVKLNTINQSISINYYLDVIPEFVALLPFFSGIILTLFLLIKLFNHNKKIVVSMILIFLAFLLIKKFSLIDNFIHFLAFIIIYHYITWFLYYLKKTRNIGDFLSRKKVYLGINIITYVFLITLFYLGNIITHELILNFYFIVFSINYFVLWVFLHITSTLINEKPINRILRF